MKKPYTDKYEKRPPDAADGLFHPLFFREKRAIRRGRLEEVYSLLLDIGHYAVGKTAHAEAASARASSGGFA